MSKETKVKSVVALSILVGAVSIVYYKNKKNRIEKIKQIMGVEKGFAKTKEQLRQLGLNPESESEFLNYTFKSIKTLEKQVKNIDKKQYTKDDIKNILINSFNLSKEETNAIIENYEILEVFEDNIDALEYLLDTLKTEQLDEESFNKLILDLYNDISSL